VGAVDAERAQRCLPLRPRGGAPADPREYLETAVRELQAALALLPLAGEE
jgi:hypothetical protein